MIRTLSIDSVGLNIFQCMFESLIFTCYPIVLFEDIGLWLHHYFLRRMLLVDTP